MPTTNEEQLLPLVRTVIGVCCPIWSMEAAILRTVFSFRARRLVSTLMPRNKMDLGARMPCNDLTKDAGAFHF